MSASHAGTAQRAVSADRKMEETMRTFLVLLAFVIFFITTLPLYLVLLILQKKHRHLCSAIAQKTVAIGFRFIMFFTGTRTVVLGRENVPKDQAVLYVANHRSLLDTPIAYSTVPTLTGFVAKIEIKKVPFLSWWMRLVNCIFLDREDLRAGMQMILTCIENINQGYSMFISPEGTRSHTDELLPFKEGSLKPAIKTGCLVIPVAISGTDEMLEKHFPWIRKAPTVIEYGKPIDPKSLSKEECKTLGAYTRDVITEMLKGHETYIKKQSRTK